MMSRIPIRWKLALWCSFASGLALLVFATFTSINLYFSLLDEEDEEVSDAAKYLLASHDDAVAKGRPFVIAPLDAWINYAIFDESGKLVIISENLDESLARASLSGHSPVTLRHKGKHWRTNVIRSSTSSIATAYDIEVIRRRLRQLVSAYILSLPVVMGVVALGSLWLSKKALLPIRVIADTAENMRADDLHRRLPVTPANDEMRRLAIVMNGLFARLEASFSQAGRFSADASHELRTPLTILRGQVDRLLRKPGDAISLENGLLDIQEELGRLERTTEQLLLLSYFDAGQVPPMASELDLSQLFKDMCEDAEMLSCSKKIVLHTQVAEGIKISANSDLLRRMLLNLLENASRYNFENGQIWCELSVDKQNAVLKISNTGPGIRIEHREKIFDRFFRCDPSRSERTGHGLGLSLSREIARIHKGDLSLSPESREGWTEFVATLPLHKA
jgi:signal transduction histidine kinase